MAADHTVTLAIVTNGGDEIGLACCCSLLQLQMHAARRTGLLLNIHIVPTFLEGLQSYVHGDTLVVMDSMCGVPAEFVFGAVERGVAGHDDVLAGVYPLPSVNWERVGAVLADPDATEPVAHAGNTYNVAPQPGGALRRYAPVMVQAVRELRVLAVPSRVLAAMASPDISYTAAAPDGGTTTTKITKHLFAYESVFEDAYANAYQTFVRRLPRGTGVLADLEAPCVLAAPAQFAGCVGMRHMAGAAIR